MVAVCNCLCEVPWELPRNFPGMKEEQEDVVRSVDATGAMGCKDR